MKQKTKRFLLWMIGLSVVLCLYRSFWRVDWTYYDYPARL
jgi:hypothetical protein